MSVALIKGISQKNGKLARRQRQAFAASQKIGRGDWARFAREMASLAGVGRLKNNRFCRRFKVCF